MGNFIILYEKSVIFPGGGGESGAVERGKLLWEKSYSLIETISVISTDPNAFQVGI